MLSEGLLPSVGGGAPQGAAATAGAGRAPRMSPALLYVLRRIALIPAGIFGVATLSFFLVTLVPSDPVGALLGDMATADDIARTRAELGLDKPVFERYTDYVARVFKGDLGESYYGGTPVLDSIVDRVTSSALLIVLGFAVAWIVGVLLGGIGAYRPGRLADRASGSVIAVTQAVPAYVAGLLGLFVFFYLFGWLPAPTGQLSIGVVRPANVTGAALVDSILDGNWDAAWDAFKHLILPVLALGSANSVVFSRLTRATLERSLTAPYSEFATARGLSQWTVVRQGFRASKISLITYAAAVVSGLLGGTAIVEQIFNWQGLGQWAVTGLTKSDLPVIQGFVLLSGLLTLLAYLVADMLVLRADPRIRRPYAS